MAGRSAARLGMFHAVGLEQLEHRVLLTAATITWTGGSATSANWSDPANWDLGRAPINGDSLVFPGSAQQQANNDDIAGLSVNSIKFQGIFDPVPGGYHIGGDDLTLGPGGITDDGTPGSTIIGVINQVNLNFNLDAAQTWSVDDSSNRHDLFVNGSVNNAGFELSLSTAGQDFIYLTGQLSGSGALSITGLTPTVELQAVNTYTGATDVENGTLIVDGSTAAASTVNVGAGATLGGTGTIGGTITAVGGNISPGAGPDPSVRTGTLTSTGDVSLAGINPPPGEEYASHAALFEAQLGGTAAAPTNDQLNSTGTVSFHLATLDLTALPGTGLYTAGQQFVIVQAGAPITTTFNGLPEGSTVSDGVQSFTISYANDRVTLTAQPVSLSAVYLNGQAGDGTPATFVHNLYRELLGREPDAAGQAYWVSVYDQLLATGSRVPGSPTAQQTLVADFLSSPEYREHLIEGMYTNFLRRAADANDLAFWTSSMAAGVDEKSVLADILGSQEYFTDAQSERVLTLDLVNPADAAAEAWVSALYRDLLGRTPDEGGFAFWMQQALNANTASERAAVAFQFLGAAEVEQKLLNGNYPGAAGSVGAPGSSANGNYALAEITGNGWDNLYFQGDLSADVVNTLFSQLQAGEYYGETINGMLGMQQYFA